jgi:hypothetical protein
LKGFEEWLLKAGTELAANLFDNLRRLRIAAMPRRFEPL